MTEITDSSGVVWRITDPSTGRAERVTPLPAKSAFRKPSAVVRYFPPEATQGPVDTSLPASVRNIVVLGILAALHGQNKQSPDAARRWLDASYADVSAEVREEVLSMWDAHRYGRAT